MARYVLISALVVVVICCFANATPLSLFGKFAKRAHDDKINKVCSGDEECQKAFRDCLGEGADFDECLQVLSEVYQQCGKDVSCYEFFEETYRSCRYHGFSSGECINGIRECRSEGIKEKDECENYHLINFICQGNSECVNKIKDAHGKCMKEGASSNECRDIIYMAVVMCGEDTSCHKFLEDTYRSCRVDYKISHIECLYGIGECHSEGITDKDDCKKYHEVSRSTDKTAEDKRVLDLNRKAKILNKLFSRK